jgi:hypothetical protein
VGQHRAVLRTASLFRSLLLLVQAGWVAGCINPALPPGAVVTCESNAGCPPGTICGGPLERCVPDVDDDIRPAFADAPVVTPKFGRAGTTFAITIKASEPLGQPPVVVARAGANTDEDGAGFALPPFDLDAGDEEGEDGDRRSYRFTYTASGDEPQGIAIIRVELVDESGNPAELTADSFVLDFVKPDVLESTLLGNPIVREGVPVEVQLTFTEPLSIEPRIFFPDIFPEPSDLVLVPRDPPIDDLIEIFVYTPLGSELEGTRVLHALLVDEAGNQIGGVEGAGAGAKELPLVVTLDFTAPQPLAVVMDTTPHGANELITSAIEFDELLASEVVVDGDVGTDRVPHARAVLRGGDPAIDYLDLDLFHNVDFIEGNTTIILQLRVRECTTEGTYTVVLDDVIDVAGNEADGVTGDWQMFLSGVACP